VALTEEADFDAAALAASVLEEEARRKDGHAKGSDDDVVIVDDLLPGVGGEEMSLKEVFRTAGAATVALLGGLVFIDAIDTAGFSVLGPDIQKSLHMSDSTLGIVGAIGGLLLFAAAVPLGYLGDRFRRTFIVGVCSTLWATFALLTGAVQAVWQLFITRTVAGIGKANEQPVHNSLLADAYPIEGRSRIYAIHRAAQPIGLVVGPALAGGVAAVAGGSAGWRWSFAILAIPAGVLGIAAFVLREPKRGGREQMAVLGAELDGADELPIAVGAAFARLKKVKTFYYLLVALGALGFVLFTAPIYQNIILKNHFHLKAGGRGLVGSIAAIGGVIGAVIAGARSEKLFRRRPESALILCGVLIAMLAVTVPLALFIPLPGYVALNVITQGLIFGAFVPVTAVVAAVMPYRLRSVGFATVGLYLSLIGGLGGAILVGGLSGPMGARGALALVAPPASILGGLLIMYGARFVRQDIAAAAAEIIEERDEIERMASGGQLAALQVRNLDFSYGSLQVLFNVSIDVWEGEVLALLGTNGAGKSTLLRAISGLGLADRGVVRVNGRTITFSDPGTRVRLGVVQVPGGRAVFPTLTVAENLMAGAYTFIWDRKRVQARFDEVLSIFPILAERIDQPAGTLSGGEQQMLALATALLLDPKILLIDELSLGLAPVVVAQLIEIVGKLKEQGLTMVIVEQSVNVALSLADRAVFMEKGEVRFEGPAAELLERDDLVRAVFLGGEGG
jgi:ABC-type branched-subunit amino acid transport system ATPase component/sugar phosphate permease